MKKGVIEGLTYCKGAIKHRGRTLVEGHRLNKEATTESSEGCRGQSLSSYYGAKVP
jgi:hypothetical protein